MHSYPLPASATVTLHFGYDGTQTGLSVGVLPDGVPPEDVVEMLETALQAAKAKVAELAHVAPAPEAVAVVEASDLPAALAIPTEPAPASNDEPIAQAPDDAA